MPYKRPNKLALANQTAGMMPRQSLAATHPSQYTSTASTAMPPPAPPTKQKQSMNKDLCQSHKTAGPVTTPGAVVAYPSPSPSPKNATIDSPPTQSKSRQPCSHPTEGDRAQSVSLTTSYPQTSRMPWEQHSDPTLTTSDNPTYWSRNHSVLKSDTDLEQGNVISPTFMHGLPFGSMTEAAHHWPSREHLERL